MMKAAQSTVLLQASIRSTVTQSLLTAMNGAMMRVSTASVPARLQRLKTAMKLLQNTQFLSSAILTATVGMMRTMHL